MNDQWRCKRCETYNDERDEKCIVCGFEHSRQIDEITGPGWIDEPTVNTVRSTGAPVSSREVIAPEEKKVSGWRIFVALMASVITGIAASSAGGDGGAVMSALSIPLLALWIWATRKK